MEATFNCKNCNQELNLIDEYSKGEQRLQIFFCTRCRRFFVVDKEDRNDYTEYDKPPYIKGGLAEAMFYVELTRC